MSTYKKEVGTSVINYAGDYPGAADGQLWYDSTNTNFKYSYGATTSAWSTGGDLNTARYGLAGAGTQTAALGFGGQNPPVVALQNLYNGSSWTEVNDLNTARMN
jgi:hypothetical protein